MKIPDDLNTVKSNIVEVVKSFPDGVGLCAFQQLYAELFGYFIYAKAYEFDDLEKLLSSMDDRLVLKYERDDVFVSLKSVRNFNCTIPVQEVPDDDVLEVVVAEVVNPGKFYVQLFSQYDRLNVLMEELDSFYAHNEESSKSPYIITQSEVAEGDLVAVPWVDNMWYRARVIGIKDLTKIRVFYLDFGTLSNIETSSARRLASDFIDFPAQAILSQLSGLLPPEGDKWKSKSAAVRMLKLTKNSHECGLKAIVLERQEKLSLWLMNNRDEGINEILVDETLAKFDKDNISLQSILSVHRDEIAILELEMVRLHTEIMALGESVTTEEIDKLYSQVESYSQRIKTFIEKHTDYTKMKIVQKSVATDWGVAIIRIVCLEDGGKWIPSQDISSLISEWRGRDLMAWKLTSLYLHLDLKEVKSGDLIWQRLVENDATGLSDCDKVVLYRLTDLPELFGYFSEKCKVTTESLLKLIQK